MSPWLYWPFLFDSAGGTGSSLAAVAMIPHGVFFQPRNGSPSWPTEPAPQGDAAVAPTPSPSPAPDATNAAPVTAPTGTGYLSQEACEQASKNGLIAAGGYTFGASLLGIMIFMVMRKKLWGNAFTRYAVSVGTAAVVSSVLVGWDPARADVLERCLDPNQGFTQYVFLGSMLVGRALVLGLLPSVLVTLTGCFVANRT